MTRLKKIRYSLVFNRKNQLNQYGEALIQIRAYQNGENRYFSTEIHVKPSQWDKRRGEINPTHPNHFVYNQQIVRLKEEIQAFEIKMINREGSFPLDRLHEYAVNHTQQDKSISFTDFFEYELSVHQLKHGTYKLYKTTLTKFQSFRKKVYFDEINYALITDFDRFLRNQGLGPNSVHKHHARVRTYINLAIKKDLLKIDDNPYKNFKAKTVEPNRVFFTKEELKRMEDLEIPQDQKHLELIKDCFLLACYTGLRYSDITNLRLGNIEQSDKGLVIFLKAKKVEKSLKAPLYLLFRQDGSPHSKPEEILYRYLQKFQAFEGIKEAEKMRLFGITNQYFNRCLKILAGYAGIKKKVTTHVARRTFATILATKVKLPILQRLLQHSRPDMTLIYIQLSNHAVEEELEKVLW